MHALITGVTGFVGSHLAERLHAAGDRVTGLARRATWPVGFQPPGAIECIACDLCDRVAVGRMLADVRPEVIYHLAGQASVPRSMEDPDGTWRSNVIATRVLYDAVRAAGPSMRIVFASSGIMYEPAAAPGARLAEDAPVAPTNPYTRSKAAADWMSGDYAAAYGLDIVRVRAFNQVGPRQSPGFVVADFARRLVAIERGAKPPVLAVGDLRPARDFTDVRDMVRAYRLLALRGSAGQVYNAGSGVGRSMREVLYGLLALTRVQPRVEQDSRLVRPADPQTLVADSSRLHACTGWSPRVPWQETLRDVLDDCRSRRGES